MLVSVRTPAFNSVLGMIFPLATAFLPDIVPTFKVQMSAALPFHPAALPHY